MYVCVCRGVTEHQIKQCVESGANNLQDLQTVLGVASGCGRCACMAEQILNDYNTMSDDNVYSLPYAAA